MKAPTTVPFVAFESANNRNERIIKKLITLCILELMVILIIIGGIVVFLCLPMDEGYVVDQELNTTNSYNVQQNVGE